MNSFCHSATDFSGLQTGDCHFVVRFVSQLMVQVTCAFMRTSDETANHAVAAAAPGTE